MAPCPNLAYVSDIIVDLGDGDKFCRRILHEKAVHWGLSEPRDQAQDERYFGQLKKHLEEVSAKIEVVARSTRGSGTYEDGLDI